METDREQRASVNAAGWRWVPERGIYLWWDGERYTGRADWDGAEWRVASIVSPAAREDPQWRVIVGFLLIGISVITLYIPGVLFGPVSVVLGVIERRGARDLGKSTRTSTVLIILGVIVFFLGAGMFAVANSPDFEL